MDQSPSKYKNKVKFMCSYGGEFLLKPHANNTLAYVGGDTKIIAVDRNISLSALRATLYSFCKTNVRITYQYPGEDLDTLISVINDEDLENMMCEYDHSCRSSTKPDWLRLLLFPDTTDPICYTSVVEVSSPSSPAKTPPDPASLIPDKPPLLETEDYNNELEKLAEDSTERLLQMRINEEDVTDYHVVNIHDQAQVQAHYVGAQPEGHFGPVAVTEFPAANRIEPQGGCFIRAPILSGIFQGMMMSDGQTYYIVSPPLQPSAAAPTQVYHNSTNGQWLLQ